MSKVYTRVYDSYVQATYAVADLEKSGIPDDEISVVANKHVSAEYAAIDDVDVLNTSTTLGSVVGGGAGFLAGIGLLAIPGLGPVVAAGWLTPMAAGAVAGAALGGLVGALIEAGVSEQEAHVFSEAIRRGGTLVTVRTDRLDGHIDDILDRWHPVNTEERRSAYAKEGWTAFDPQAPNYRLSEAEIERMRRADD